MILVKMRNQNSQGLFVAGSLNFLCYPDKITVTVASEIYQ